MYFDFEDYRPDISPVGRAISWREGILISIILHLMMALLLVVWPRLFPYDAEAARARLLALEQQWQQQQQQLERQPERFVFVQPLVDLRALRPPERAEPSDEDRRARARERAEQPTNPLPFLRGNTPERVEQAELEAARGQTPEPDPSVGQQARAEPPSVETELPKLPEAPSALQLPPNKPPENTVRPSGGSLGEALRNLQRYVQRDQFQNPGGGGGSFGPAIQFDTKGVEFGPWIRRFVAQVRRNWGPLIPQVAAFTHGHVVITFNVHKNGSITDLAVVQPASIDAFNTAAYGALVSSNPTAPLPPEYPSDRAFFTVTFFYNEEPQ